MEKPIWVRHFSATSHDALDTTNAGSTGQEPQIAYYHDGVGTSSFKPLAVLGGAFGWGLKRNVLDLYTFLCRNYEPGDQIYAFGFSRGAFTVRILAAMVVLQGLVEDSSEEDLKIYATDAYRLYRRGFNQTGGLVTLLRNVRDVFLGWSRKLSGRQTYAQRQANPATTNHVVEVEFLGVWDTVAAYGMLYTQVRSQAEATRAREIAGALQNAGFTGPSASEVRYFRAAERPSAKRSWGSSRRPETGPHGCCMSKASRIQREFAPNTSRCGWPPPTSFARSSISWTIRRKTCAKLPAAAWPATIAQIRRRSVASWTPYRSRASVRSRPTYQRPLTFSIGPS